MRRVVMKKWNMKPRTRIIVSEAYKLCEEMNRGYGQRVTVRQIYYNLFSKGIIQLNQREYRRVCRILTNARKRGYIPFEWIEDRSRRPLMSMLYGDIQEFLGTLIEEYKRDTWKGQDRFVIILVEKEALAPIIWDIAKEYNVFVFPTKGFPSWSMFVEDLRQLVECFGAGKELIVLVLSDLDPSGEHIKEDYKSKLDFMAKELGFRQPYIIEKVAVTEEQVKKYNLPPMYKSYKNKGTIPIWELDALDPKILRQIVKEAIEKYINLELLYKDLETEEKEKEMLRYIANYGVEAYLDAIGGNG